MTFGLLYLSYGVYAYSYSCWRTGRRSVWAFHGRSPTHSPNLFSFKLHPLGPLYYALTASILDPVTQWMHPDHTFRTVSPQPVFNLFLFLFFTAECECAARCFRTNWAFQMGITEVSGGGGVSFHAPPPPPDFSHSSFVCTWVSNIFQPPKPHILKHSCA